MAKFDQFWGKLKSKILLRQRPITSLHWQFLNPLARKNVRLHRYVLLNSYKEFPFILRLFGLSYTYIKWWLIDAWRQIYRSYKYNHKHYYKTHNISAGRQLWSLIRLSYGFNIPPSEYYLMRLHRWPSSQWLDFIYDFQAQTWHNAFSSGESIKPQQELLKNKSKLELFLRDNNIACVNSLITVPSKTSLSDKELAALPKHLFLKPLSGNQSLGCYFYERLKADSYALTYFRYRQKRYQLNLENFESLISNQDYLFQELLSNHSDVSELFQVDECVVLRIVTMSNNSTIDVAFCSAEIPFNPQTGSHWIIQVDLNSHRFIVPENHIYPRDLFDTYYANIEAHVCPFVDESLKLCIESHTLLSEIPSIAWDIALAKNEPTIIEGNSAWGCAVSQAFSATPVLNGKLGKHFEQLAFNHE